MRLFNLKEKTIIQQLINGTVNSLAYLPINVFNDIFHSRDVGFIGESTMELVFPNIENGSINEFLTIYNDILERALLIDYLEKEGLIYIIPTSTSDYKHKTIGNVIKLNRIAMKIDQSIGEILLKCINRPVYVSETLKDYVNNGFKSLEDLALEETKKQTKYSFYAVILAFVAIIISMLQMYKESYNETKSEELSVPINGILNYMQNNLNNKLDATINNTTEIKAKLCDSIVIKNPCNCKKQPIYKPKKKDSCIKYIQINTCQDTIISKQHVKANNMVLK